MVLAANAADPPSGAPTLEQMQSWLLAKPYPEYPTDARARRTTGSGLFKLHFISKTGTVRYVQVIQSTGDKSLDAACIRAFRRWRFKPGVVPSMKRQFPQTKEPFADEDFIV